MSMRIFRIETSIDPTSIRSCMNTTVCVHIHIYVLPTLSPTNYCRALVYEKCNSWKAKFKNKECFAFTGDSSNDNTTMTQLSKKDIILTTPEKWDSMTRRWGQLSGLMNQVGLLMIDEVHILGEKRGACLEGLVARSKMMTRKLGTNLRFVALSATIPNPEDIAKWLDAEYLTFGSRFRPVPLQYHVMGYRNYDSGFKFSNMLNFKLLSIIREYSNGRPSLIFCNTKKETLSAANQVINSSKEHGRSMFVSDPQQRQRLREAARRIKYKPLAEVVANGVGIHHADLEHSDRELVEKLFIDEDLLVLCSTSTLAMGVNLPAHLVIIKSTQVYRSGQGYVDMEMSDILQMIGRAGRPQFDTEGVAVVMTMQSTVAKYQDIISGHLPIESHLLSNMTGHLNAEVATGIIVDEESAIEWLRSTFLFQRALQNSAHYQIHHYRDKTHLEQLLKDVVFRELRELEKSKVVEFGNTAETKKSLRPTKLGQLMARHYMTLATMRLIAEIPRDCKLQTMLEIFCRSEEFKDQEIRMGEKMYLNAINKCGRKQSTKKKSTKKDASNTYRAVRHPIKTKLIKERWQKVCVLEH